MKPTASKSEPGSRLTVLMFTDIVGSSALKVELGDAKYVEDVAVPHNRIFRQVLGRFPGAVENNYTGDGFLATFERVSDAVNVALLFHHALRTQVWSPKLKAPIETCIGIHLGESVLFEGPEPGKLLLASHAADMCARVMGLASGGQTLLTRAAFDNARQYVREHPPISDVRSAGFSPSPTEERAEARTTNTPPSLEWLAHGPYLFKGRDEPMEVFEVGAVGFAPLRAPGDSAKAKRALSIEEEQTLGWRPGLGLEIPGKPGWVIDRKLGEGGFGEVWLVRHAKTKQQRVFKFCFDPDRLRSFQRELTLFRLIREALGERDDIAPLLDVRLEQQPFYLESEYIDGGNLSQWAASRGGIAAVPLATRLDLLARVARAVAAAHSVGIIHKDIKPSNVFIRELPDGSVRPMISDFGIGVLADRTLLERHAITDAGFTDSLVAGNDSNRTGTRLYAPPQSLVGKPATTAGDIYALGVMLYQLVVADFDRPLGTGWERELADELLRDDIRDCVEGDPARRPASAVELAERLETLPKRRAELEARHRAERTAARLRRLRIAIAVAAGLIVSLSGLMGFSYVQWRRADDNLRLALEYSGTARTIVREYYLETGFLLSGAERPEAVATLYEEAIKIKEKLASDNPNVADYSLGLAAGYYKLGLEHQEAGKLDDSVDWLTKARRVLEPLLQIDAREEKLLDGALHALQNRERGIVELRYGMGDGFRYMGEEAARIFKITPEESRTIEERALEKLGPETKRQLDKQLAKRAAKPLLRKADSARAVSLEALAKYSEAVTAWEQSIAGWTPYQGIDRDLLKMRHARALALAKNHRQAFAEVLKVVKRNSGSRLLLDPTDEVEVARDKSEVQSEDALPPKREYDAACVFALAAAAVENDTELENDDRARLANEYAARAIELLKRVLSRGPQSIDTLRKDADLSAIRDHPAYRIMEKESEDMQIVEAWTQRGSLASRIEDELLEAMIEQGEKRFANAIEKYTTVLRVLRQVEAKGDLKSLPDHLVNSMPRLEAAIAKCKRRLEEKEKE